MPTDMEIIQRKILENTYLQATQALMCLADGIQPQMGVKLEDKDFQRISEVASVKNPGSTAVLLSTISYTFFQLKFAYNWPWESIEYRQEVLPYMT